MLLHFIFLIKENEELDHDLEFDYIRKMAKFFAVWIKQKFSLNIDVTIEKILIPHQNILQRLDTPYLLMDHLNRDSKIYHFYLCFFKPIWTDCTCHGYHAENFGMIWWQTPKQSHTMIQFMAEKNCATISHEISHELLRQKKYKNYIDIVHTIWSKHYFDNLPFECYNDDFKYTDDSPYFLTINTSLLSLE